MGHVPSSQHVIQNERRTRPKAFGRFHGPVSGQFPTGQDGTP